MTRSEAHMRRSAYAFLWPVLALSLCIGGCGEAGGRDQELGEIRALLEKGDLPGAATAMNRALPARPGVIGELLGDTNKRVRLACLLLMDTGQIPCGDLSLLEARAVSPSLEGVLCCKILVRSGHPQYLAVLLRCMSSPDAQVAFAAASAIPDGSLVAYSDELDAASRSASPAVRETVANLLARDDSNAGYKALLRLAHDENAAVRMNALGAIGTRLDEKDRGRIESLLNDTDPLVRDNAKSVLRACGRRAGP